MFTISLVGTQRFRDQPLTKSPSCLFSTKYSRSKRWWLHKVIECDAEALKAIVRNGYSEKQGARRIRNAAREAVQEVIREALLSGGETRGRLEYNGHSKSFFING
jgi:C-terminal, D2-small domain, of ClpB protein